MQLHWVATYLDPSFRDLCFVTDKTYRSTQQKAIKEGLITMTIDIESVSVKHQHYVLQQNIFSYIF